MEWLPVSLLVIVALLALGQIVLAVYLFRCEQTFERRMVQAFKRSLGVLEDAELGNVAPLERMYEDQLRLAVLAMGEDFGKVVAAAQQEFGQFLAQLREESKKSQETKDKELSTLVDDSYLAFTKRLEDRLAAVEGDILKTGEAEAAKIKTEVDAYREKMKQQIDNQAAAVLSEVVKKVLARKLSVDDQANLVIEALDQAKKENFL